MPDEKDTVLQNTDHGYVETPVDEIPLSDNAGEGRKGKAPDDADTRRDDVADGEITPT